MLTCEKKRLDLLSVLPKDIGATKQWQVDIGAAKTIKGARLLARREPDEVANERQERSVAYARAHQKPINAYVMELARWTIIVTNVPANILSLEQAFDLLHARGPIELLFKLWKQHALLDQWNGSKPWRVLCEVYAKLLAVVVQHWFLLLRCWDDPNRSLSAVAEILREQVPTLVHGLTGRLPLQRAVRTMLCCVRGGCSLPPRSTRPNTSRLLLSALGPGLT